jgi:hypothetical protein
MPPRIYCQPELSSHRRPASHAFLPARPANPTLTSGLPGAVEGAIPYANRGQTIVQGIGLLEGSVCYVAHDLNDLPHDTKLAILGSRKGWII